MSEPAKKAPAKAAAKKADDGPPLPTHKDDLAALAIDRGVPSYDAWAMNVDDLTALLKKKA